MAQQARLELLADSSQIKTATKDLRALETQGSKTEKGVTGFSRSLNKASNNTAVFGRSAGQAGIQVQQFVGQVQGGQSALLALSQQGADLGIVLGAPLVGVVVSLGAALAATLIPSLDDSESSAEKLEKTLESLGDVAASTESGVLTLSDEIAKLAEVSEQAARARIAGALIETRDAAKQAGGAINDAFDNLGVGVGLSSISDYTETIQSTLGASQKFRQVSTEIGEELGFVGEEARDSGAEVIKLLSVIRNAPTPDAFSELQEILAQSINADKASDDVIRLNNEITAFFTQARTAEETARFLSGTLEQLGDGAQNVGDIASAATPKVASFLSKLEAQRVTLEEGEVAGRLYAAAIATGAESVLELDENIREQIISLYTAEQAAKAEADAVVEAEKRKAEARRQAGKESKKQESERAKFESFSQGLDREQLSFESPTAQIEAQFQERQAIIDSYREKGVITEQEWFDERLTSWSLFEQQKTKITEQNAELRNQLEADRNKATLNAFGTLFGTLAEITKEGGEDSFKEYKVFASAQAGVAGALAIMQALGSAPPPFNFALAGVVGAATAIQIAKIQNMEYSGARALGGQVLGGNQYLVGERGPEVISMNSSGNGRVTPFNQLMSESRRNEGSSVTNNDTFNINITSPSNEVMNQWAANNVDVIYNAVRRAKRRDGKQF